MSSFQSYYTGYIYDCTLYLLYNITGPESGVPLDIKHLTDLVVPNMATKWFEMGLQLGVNPKELTTIQHDAKNSKEACIMMFMEWLGNTNNPSWQKVLDALCARSVRESTLAKNLRRSHPESQLIGDNSKCHKNKKGLSGL